MRGVVVIRLTFVQMEKNDGCHGGIGQGTESKGLVYQATKRRASDSNCYMLHVTLDLNLPITRKPNPITIYQRYYRC